MSWLVTAARVLPGPAGEVVEDGAVLVADGEVRAVGPREEIERRAPVDSARRDYPRGTLVPGLIDAHVHLVLDAGDDPVGTLRAADDGAVYRGMLDRAERALRSGVTTVRDLGDRGGLAITLRDAIARGEALGPRVLAAGSPLTVPNGHCWFLGGVVDGPEEIRERIGATAARGADAIKVMASGGSITPNSPSMWESQFGDAELRLVVEEAARHGLPVAAHAHGTEAITAAVAAGVSTVEHCTWMSPQRAFERPGEPAADMARLGIAACVATSLHWRKAVEANPQRARQRFGRLPWMDDLGITLIPGTDAGLGGSEFDAFVEALEVYEHVGFRAERVLEMATVTSARVLGIGDRVGRLAPGYSADLLAVDGDPRDRLATLRSPRLVLARGRECRADS